MCSSDQAFRDFNGRIIEQAEQTEMILPGGNGEVPAGEPVVYGWDMKNGQFVKTFS